jgi:flagellar basal-body rod protein FlgF
MDNNIYIALSRQMALFRDLEVTANNIANVNTTGYQAEKIMFEDYLSQGGMFRGDQMAFVRDKGSYLDERPGSKKVTGNPLDIAIDKTNTYFRIETPQGERYTRAGSFQIDSNGTLVTQEGNPVLDDAGQRIEFEQEDNQIEFRENGLLVVDGEERNVLGLAEFANPQKMERVGSTLFKSTENPAQSETARVMHGVLENSNVQSVLELVHLTDLSRSAGETAKYIEVMYDLQRKTSNAWTQQN